MATYSSLATNIQVFYFKDFQRIKYIDKTNRLCYNSDMILIQHNGSKKRILFLVALIFSLILSNSKLFCKDDQILDNLLKDETQTITNEKKQLLTETEIIFNIDYPWNGYISATEKLHLFTKKNHKEYLELDFNTELSLATLSTSFFANFNYLKFFNVFYNFEIGSGWNYLALNFWGLAENYNHYGQKYIKLYNFSKALIKNSIGLKFLINLNFFFKNKWSDFSLSTSQSFSHNTLLPKKENEFWFYKNDAGENRRGFLYIGLYSIQYKMPLYLSSINVDFSSIKKLYKPIKGTKNKAEQVWNFALNTALSFTAFEFLDIKLSSLFASEYNYTDQDERLHFTEKILNYDKVINFYFKSISASFIFKIKN